MFNMPVKIFFSIWEKRKEMHNDFNPQSTNYFQNIPKDVTLNPKHNRSLKVAVQGLVFVAHPLYIQL
jgi:hypothetical protein